MVSRGVQRVTHHAHVTVLAKITTYLILQTVKYCVSQCPEVTHQMLWFQAGIGDTEGLRTTRRPPPCSLVGTMISLKKSVLLRPPPPLPSSVSVELSGAYTRQRPRRSTAAHAAKQHAVVALSDAGQLLLLKLWLWLWLFVAALLKRLPASPPPHEPSTTKNSSSSRAHLALNWDNRRSAKMRKNR